MQPSNTSPYAFRRPEFVPEIVEAAIRIGARAVWMQEGVLHEEAAWPFGG